MGGCALHLAVQICIREVALAASPLPEENQQVCVCVSVSDAKEKSPITGCCRKPCHYQEGSSLAQSPARGN